MPLLVGDQLCGLDGSTAQVPGDALAIGVGADVASVLYPDGSIHRIWGAPLGHVATIELPERLEKLAISADGSLVVASIAVDGFDDHCDVVVCHGDASAPVPDFLVEITTVQCAADGRSFGYGYLTGQPYSMDGSYGSRTYGAVVVGIDGRITRSLGDTRGHDEHPRIEGLGWATSGFPLAMSYRTERDAWVEIAWGVPVEDTPPPWMGGYLETPVLKIENWLENFDHGGAVSWVVARSGELAGYVTEAARLVLHRRSDRTITVVDDVLAASLEQPGQLWTIDRERQPRSTALDSLCWEPNDQHWCTPR